MAQIGLTEAAKLTGKSPSTITRRSNHKDQRKRLSFTINGDGERVYDVAELQRVFGDLKNANTTKHAPVQETKNARLRNDLQQSLKEAHEREIVLLREQNALLHTQLQDIQKDRDEWRNQAKQHTVLIEDHRKREDALKQSLEAAQKPVERPKKIFGIFPRSAA